MRRWLVAALLGAIWTGQAFAYSDEQLNVMSHIGQAIAATRICSRVTVSDSAAAIMLAAYEVKLDDPVVAGVVKSKIEETVAAWAGKSEDLACAAVLMLYGPAGSNVPNLLLPKD